MPTFKHYHDEPYKIVGRYAADMPSPTEEQLASPEFEAIWKVIRTWDINAPEFHSGYCGANGSHVALILNALDALETPEIGAHVTEIYG